MTRQNVCVEKQKIMISKDDADIVFGYTKYSPCPVLRWYCNAYTETWDETRRKELRLLLVTAKAYVRYRSRDVETLVRMLCSRFLEDVYRERSEVESDDLPFLLTFVWHYRHLDNENDMERYDAKVGFCDRFRRLLFERGLAKSYQTSLF